MNINIKLEDYKKIKKIIKNDNELKHYKLDIEIKSYPYNTKEFWLIEIVKALNIKDIKERYMFIYEEMCNILDNISHKVCDFKCDKCIKNRINGCCYFRGKLCPYLVNSVCQCRSVSCKIYMCSLVERKYHFKSKVDTYPLFNLFFNKKQKEIIHYSYRQNIEEVIPKLLDAIK